MVTGVDKYPLESFLVRSLSKLVNSLSIQGGVK